MIAFLGSLESEKLQEKQSPWWVQVEKNLHSLNLDEKTRERVFQSLAQKTPRPTQEEMVKARQERAALDAYFENFFANVEPEAPPLVNAECGTPEKELEKKTGIISILWGGVVRDGDVLARVPSGEGMQKKTDESMTSTSW